MSVNEKLKDAEAGDYGSIAPEPENDAVAYVKRHTIALGVLCVLAFGAAVKVDDDLLKGRDKNGVPLDAAAAALPPTPPASALCRWKVHLRHVSRSHVRRQSGSRDLRRQQRLRRQPVHGRPQQRRVRLLGQGLPDRESAGHMRLQLEGRGR